MRLAPALLVAALLPAVAARADQVFLREVDAPRALFGDGVTSERKTLELSDAELSELSRQVGRRVDARAYPYLEVSEPGRGARSPLGYIFLLDVLGQNLPITFAVGIKADGAVQDVQVMVYREPHGGEIRERRFRAQFSGRRVGQPLVIGKDVDAISGATISSHSAAYAVRKGLGLADILRRRAGQKAP
ncbi:MAG TPA: FMN-binding protein [Anaeromyxobacteraceae bacterium]